MMTVMEMVRRVTPPMNEAAPMRANAPGSIQDQVLGGRNTPLGALQQGKYSRSAVQCLGAYDFVQEKRLQKERWHVGKNSRQFNAQPGDGAKLQPRINSSLAKQL